MCISLAQGSEVLVKCFILLQQAEELLAVDTCYFRILRRICNIFLCCFGFFVYFF